MGRLAGIPSPGSSPHRRSRAWLWWVAAVVLAVGLVAVSWTAPARSVQQAASRLLTPVRVVVTGIGTAVADVVETVATVGQLRDERDQLQNDLAATQQRLAELRAAAHENALLRQLLGLRAAQGWDLLAVQVTSVPTGAVQWEFGIDRGRQDGIEVGMPVVAAVPGGGALAGTVVAAGSDWGTVQLIVDPRARAVAQDQATGALGVVQGQPGGQLVMTEVATTDEVAVGDPVVTAGLAIDGVAASAYPAGLLIGTVSAVEDDPNGLTRTVFVSPAIDPHEIEWLMVVLGSSPAG